MAKKKQDPVSQYLAEIGRKGGAAGTGKAKARDPEKMRAAANKRWENKNQKNKSL